MTLSLTDWLQQNRLVVVSVDASRRRVRVKSAAAGLPLSDVDQVESRRFRVA